MRLKLKANEQLVRFKELCICGGRILYLYQNYF